MNGLIVFIFVVLLAYYLYSYLTFYNENTYVKSNIDNNSYLIRRNKNSVGDKYLQKSADTLANINLKVEKLIKFIENKSELTRSSEFYYLDKLKSNYGHHILSEAVIDKKFTTFTVDKRKIHICLRTRDSHEKLYDENILMYVLLHELAHLCNYNSFGYPINGHGKEFVKIFHSLVKNAIDAGVYKYVDYRSIPVEYCGIIINSQIV